MHIPNIIIEPSKNYNTNAPFLFLCAFLSTTNEINIAIKKLNFTIIILTQLKKKKKNHAASGIGREREFTRHGKSPSVLVFRPTMVPATIRGDAMKAQIATKPTYFIIISV